MKELKAVPRQGRLSHNTHVFLSITLVLKTKKNQRLSALGGSKRTGLCHEDAFAWECEFFGGMTAWPPQQAP